MQKRIFYNFGMKGIYYIYLGYGIIGFGITMTGYIDAISTSSLWLLYVPFNIYAPTLVEEFRSNFQSTFNLVITLILQKEELGFHHQEVAIPSVPTPDKASNKLIFIKKFQIAILDFMLFSFISVIASVNGRVTGATAYWPSSSKVRFTIRHILLEAIGFYICL